MPNATAARVQLAAAASVALRPMLEGPSRRAELMGVSRHAAWVDVDGDVVVVSDAEAVRLPNALELSLFRLDSWIRETDLVEIGTGMMKIADLDIVPRRWFDPRPVLRSTPVDQLHAALAILKEVAQPRSHPELQQALQFADANGLVRTAAELLGGGEGLTPEGDDVVAGALAAYVLLGTATGKSIQWLTTAGLEEWAQRRTTGFSYSLIVHALRGEVAQPFAGVLRGLVGDEHLPAAVAQLQAVGHTSGQALIEGILAAGSAISEENLHA